MRDWKLLDELDRLSNKWSDDILHGHGTPEDCAEELKLLVDKLRKDWYCPRIGDKG